MTQTGLGGTDARLGLAFPFLLADAQIRGPLILQFGFPGGGGKRLDFLMQELNREANTLASKSISSDITAIALELKLLIEQMREQVQNLE